MIGSPQDVLEQARAPVDPDLPPISLRPEDELRMKLAVRGWVEPLRLMYTSGEEDASTLLAPLAREVETAIETRPGQWFLSVSARKLVFARRTRGQLRAAARPLFPQDEADPVRRAVELALSDDMPAPATLDTDVLSALANVCQWFDADWNAPFGAHQIASELASRALDDDLARMTRLPMVGATHQHTLDELLRFTTEPPRALISAAYVYGGGGAGKTTLLAFLQHELRRRPRPVPTARIDFDEPAIDPARPVTLNLAMCEQLARYLPQLGERLAPLRQTALIQRRADAARAQDGRQFASQAESVMSEAASDEGSIMYLALDNHLVAGPIVIIFDTAELIVSLSDRIAAGLVSWLQFLLSEAGAADIRLIIAGRDAPDVPESGYATSSLLSRLKRTGAHVEPPIRLPELDQAEAAQLLRNCGIRDERIVAEAAQAVPGNPLLLRITGEALGRGDQALRDDVQVAHRESRVDAESARNYLLRRIVAHVSDPVARPYVLAAGYSPVITRALLEEVVIPCVDRHATEEARPPILRPDAARGRRHGHPRDKAERVFRSLTATHWLVRPTLDADSVPFNRDVRSLALKLMAATQESGVLEGDLRRAAIRFHSARDTPQDRAFVLYHKAMLGEPYRLPDDRDATRQLLRDVMEELPDELRRALDAPTTVSDAAQPSATIADADGTSSMTDREWRRYLEGDKDREGEGAQMVRADRARDALDLYRARPIGDERRPPTFVLQALADLGEWDDGLVDVEAIVEEEGPEWLRSPGIEPSVLSRLYWTTRLALLAKHGQLSNAHVRLLEQVTADSKGLTSLAALIAIAEAALRRPIMDDGLRRNALRSDCAGRVWLALAPARSVDILMVHPRDVAVSQGDWWSRVERFRAAVPDEHDRALMEALQPRMNGLHRSPFADVSRLFNEPGEDIGILPQAVDSDGRVLLLRGMTTEFHRPLREALLTLYGDGMPGPRTSALLEPTLEQMSLCPGELLPETFHARANRNPRTWCTALVSYADRCRLLPSLCARLAEQEGTKLARVAASFIGWDRALCHGGSSDWNAPHAGNPE
ncbi:MAG TPA: hypothetical protein VGD21_08080 [Lysobacter sp.]